MRGVSIHHPSTERSISILLDIAIDRLVQGGDDLLAPPRLVIVVHLKKQVRLDKTVDRERMSRRIRLVAIALEVIPNEGIRTQSGYKIDHVVAVEIVLCQFGREGDLE